MSAVTLICLTLLVTAGEPSETPTRIYVRTVPTGAAVSVGGKVVGKSDGLFTLSPGIQTLLVELDGYSSEERQVEVRPEEITRVELRLKKRPAVPPNPGTTDDAGSEAASAYLANTEVPQTTRNAMLAVLRQHPAESRWSGRVGTSLFAIAVKKLPGEKISQRAIPAMLELTHMLSVHELLKAKSLLDQYAATGLTDATTLREAVVEAAGKLEVTGKATGAVHQAAIRQGFAVAYVVAEEPALTGSPPTACRA